jgi:hypothetical protein
MEQVTVALSAFTAAPSPGELALRRARRGERSAAGVYANATNDSKYRVDTFSRRDDARVGCSPLSRPAQLPSCPRLASPRRGHASCAAAARRTAAVSAHWWHEAEAICAGRGTERARRRSGTRRETRGGPLGSPWAPPPRPACVGRRLIQWATARLAGLSQQGRGGTWVGMRVWTTTAGPHAGTEPRRPASSSSQSGVPPQSAAGIHAGCGGCDEAAGVAEVACGGGASLRSEASSSGGGRWSESGASSCSSSCSSVLRSPMMMRAGGASLGPLLPAAAAALVDGPPVGVWRSWRCWGA